MAAELVLGPVAGGRPSTRLVRTAGDDAVIYDFSPRALQSPRVLVLKLDHLGDFIIGLPALRRLREVFPTSPITLVVGSWNRGAAEACGLADRVVVYDFFSAVGWSGEPTEPVARFRALVREAYDIAIDLRVDGDTRHLLAEANAGLRCGIGTRSGFPFLDIALPQEPRSRDAFGEYRIAPAFLEPGRFTSHMPFKRAFYHETDFRPVRGHVVHGPQITLPIGRFTARFDVRVTGLKLGLRSNSITLDVARNGADMVAKRRLGWRERLFGCRDGVPLSFENQDASAFYEFRIFIRGRPRATRLRFGGVRLDRADETVAPRLRRAELHVGEQLSLLVQLVADRTRPLYAASQAAAGGGAVVIAPFSNKELRDWPAGHYAELARLLIKRLGSTVTLIGSPQQSDRLARLAQTAGHSDRIRNLGGQTAWSDLPALLRAADLVICNNSGIAHLAAAAGARTLAIYSASHQPPEWGPRGGRSHAIMSVVPCSPCGYEHHAECLHQHRCMQGLVPETVYAEAAALLRARRAE